MQVVTAVLTSVQQFNVGAVTDYLTLLIAWARSWTVPSPGGITRLCVHG
jgi:hypothetical protein